jgi:hypothetical protein
VPITYSVEVPGDKKPWGYKVFVREAETNARLSTLIVPAGTALDPAFNAAVHSYILVVPYAVSSVRIEARGQSRGVKSVTVNGAESPGPVGAAVVDFAGVAERPVTIEALAEDGVTREQYTINIQRAAPDNNALLGSLELRDAALSPTFSAMQLGYQAQVPFEARQVVIRARAQSPVATVSLGLAATAGGASTALQYKGNPSDNAGALIDFSVTDRIVVTVVVTAEDGTVQQYLLDIQRAPPDGNNALAALSLVSGSGAVIPVNPPFTAARLAYLAEIPFATQRVTVVAAPQSAKAQAALEDSPAAGARSAAGDLRSGATLDLVPGTPRVALGVAVTAQDGSVRHYVVEIRRAQPDRNSDLASLSASAGALSPQFSPRLPVYTVLLPATAETVQLSASAASPTSLVGVAEQPGIKLAQGQAITLAVAPGATTVVTFVVSAEDGSQRAYRVQVIRQAPPAQPPAPPPTQGTTPPAQGTTPPAQPPAGGTGTSMAPIAIPPDSGADHVTISAKNLRLQPAEAQALLGAHDAPGALARITVRYYRTNDLITQYTVPVDVRQQGPNAAIDIQTRSNGVTLARDRLIEVELAIPTRAGHFLYYTEAQASDAEVSIDIPFLLYGDNPRMGWPAIGSPVQVSGYLLKLPLGKPRAVDAEDFDKNAKGEYAVSVEVTDARSGVSYGKDTVLSAPGVGRDRTLTFGKSLAVPEGARVRYLLSAVAKNGRQWSAAGVAQIWTTLPAYPNGFLPVALNVSEDLALAGPAGPQAGKGDQGNQGGKDKKN